MMSIVNPTIFANFFLFLQLNRTAILLQSANDSLLALVVEVNTTITERVRLKCRLFKQYALKNDAEQSE